MDKPIRLMSLITAPMLGCMELTLILLEEELCCDSLTRDLFSWDATPPVCSFDAAAAAACARFFSSRNLACSFARSVASTSFKVVSNILENLTMISNSSCGSNLSFSPKYSRSFLYVF